MKVIPEIGIIFKEDWDVLSVSVGTSCSVEFDTLALSLEHLKHPQDWKMLHTHPSGIYHFSDVDFSLMKAVVLAIYPYILEFAVLCDGILHIITCRRKDNCDGFDWKDDTYIDLKRG